MLALIAMENPGNLNAEAIRARREDVINALVSPTAETISQSALRAQYNGYQEENDVNPESTTDTYFLLKSYIHNPRWEGVPFYLESGKCLSRSRVDITIYFREMKYCLCSDRDKEEGHSHPRNILRFRIQPDEAIQSWLWVKKPGFDFELVPAKLSFLYSDTISKESIPDAYERILYDCILGDQTLFVSTKEVQSEWQYITELGKLWERNPLWKYEKGSEGPDERKDFMGEVFID